MNLKRLFDIRSWRTSRSRTLEEIDEEFEFHLEHRPEVAGSIPAGSTDVKRCDV